MLVASLLMGLTAFFAAPLVLGMMGVPQELMADATTYMRMSCIGVPLVAVYNYSSSMLCSLGDSKTPLYFLILSCFLNIGLDILFVYVFHLGVFGAAVATIIAQMLSGIVIPMALVAMIPDIGRMGIWWTTVLTWIISAGFCMLRYVAWRTKADFSKSVV